MVSGLSGQRIYIEDIFPAVDSGRFPVKRIAGEPVEVWADIFRDGHAVLAAELIWRAENSKQWSRNPLKFHQNDRWFGSFTPEAPGPLPSMPSRPGPTLSAPGGTITSPSAMPARM